jgi:two-component system sensor histidine kinase DegS
VVSQSGCWYCILKSSEFDFETNRGDLLNQLLYIIVIALENAFMMEQIEHSRIEMRSLAGKTITIQEEERKRIAADIHDIITQSLTGIGYKIQYCQEMARSDPKQVGKQLDLLLSMVHGAINQSREMISTLRPVLIDTLRVVPALEKFLQVFGNETGIEILTSFPQAIDLSSEIKICIFRVVQEGLMNVYKHAAIKKARVKLKKTGEAVQLTISDNGKGFDPGAVQYNPRCRQHMGMLIIRERIEAVGGKLTIRSARNEGCRIEIEIPIINYGILER